MHRTDLSAKLTFSLFVFFSLGLLIGKVFGHFLFFLFLSAVFLILSFKYSRNKPVLSDLFIIFLFICLGSCSISSFNKKNIDTFLGRAVSVKFRVISLDQENEGRRTLKVQLLKADNQPFNFVVNAIDYTKSLQYMCLYETKAKISRHYFNRHEFYNLWIKKDSNIQLIPSAKIYEIRKKTLEYFLSVLKQNCSDQAYRFISAAFLGRRELIRHERDHFSRAGAAHLLAISGLHIGLCSMLFFFCLRFFHIPFKASLIMSLLFIYSYTFLTGSSGPTVRALIMYSSFVMGFLLRRKIDVLNSLGLAGLIILVLDPSAIFSIGFQLSFVAVFAIIAGFRHFKISKPSNSLICYLKYTFFSSFFAWFLLLPLISFYFSKINLLSPLANLILIPFFTVILAVTFLLLFFAPLTFVVQSLGSLLSFLTSYFFEIVRNLANLKFASISYSLTAIELCLYYLFSAMIFISLARLRQGLLLKG
ncbi:MAG: ComEC/Rec2 family competence protein [Candidatus Omnitrophica bacterium]|nr:ComEC/Rec2 family competence protein [Candidatus Omnitrophota bacterium]